ncbi:MAG TPA: flagellar hook capping FlgD N-terminal domain-containing protein [Chitinispirillaceae bacterium]|nr:flagellar hook capping FlgD N-terminal domain-containing protein [Chitinispirillaceae bacterium]
MAYSSDIASLTSKTEPYTVRASVKDNQVDATTSVATGDRTTDLFSSKNDLGKDDFLLLLVTQMRYQDPMNPMENTEFVSQLAQFRSMESSSNIESAINKLNESFQGTVKAQNYAAQSITNTSAVSLIGKKVRLKQTDVNWVATAGNKINFKVNIGNNKSAVLQIKDEDGNLIRSFVAKKNGDSCETMVEWDGTDDKGKVAKTGKYEIHFDNEDNDPSIYAFVEDKASGIRFTDDGAMVKVGDSELSIGKIIDVAGGNSYALDTEFSGGNSAISLIGKEVRVKSSTVNLVTLDNGTSSGVAQIETGGADSVVVNIVDSMGNIIWTERCLNNGDDSATLSWNGQKSDGTYANKGKYSLKIEGAESNPYLYSFVEGRVDGITDVGGSMKLKVNGVYVNVSDILSIDA